MIRRLALAAALATGLAGAALAQDANEKQNACLDQVMALFQDAEKKVAADKKAGVEELLAKMETHCAANQFTEADAVAKDIKAAIGN